MTSPSNYVETIKRYYEGCNARDAELMLATFCDDVVHYFVDHSAVRGASALANYWCKVAPKTQATWSVDHVIVEEPEAVIEWTMRWTPAATGKPELLRGTEWFVFKEGAIAEIRSYHCNFYLNDPANRALQDFDYAGRGYSTD